MVPSGFGLCIPWQNAERDPGYYLRARSTLKASLWRNHKFDGAAKGFSPTLYAASDAEQQAQGVSASGIGDKLWMVGNEPEKSSEGDETPEEFACGVEYWDSNINKPFAAPGILWGQEGRQWWSDYKKLSAPEPDAYHIHIYAHDAVSWFSQLQDALRTFGDKPLVISECGGWFLVPVLQSEIMQSVYMAIALKMIPAAFWFSAHYSTYDPSWSSTDCLDSNENITDVGNSYRYWANRPDNTIYIPVIMGA